LPTLGAVWHAVCYRDLELPHGAASLLNGVCMKRIVAMLLLAFPLYAFAAEEKAPAGEKAPTEKTEKTTKKAKKSKKDEPEKKADTEKKM